MRIHLLLASLIITTYVGASVLTPVLAQTSETQIGEEDAETGDVADEGGSSDGEPIGNEEDAETNEGAGSDGPSEGDPVGSDGPDGEGDGGGSSGVD